MALAGKSKYIYLWNIDQPNEPKVIWQGHQYVVEQIVWDPQKRLLASCSEADPFVCIWSAEKNTPELCLDKATSEVTIIRWSNSRRGED